MKYFIIAGEASGDLLGAKLINALKQQDPKAVFQVWGGDNMQAEGVTVLKHIKSLAFFGVLEVLLNIRTILRNIASCKQQVSEMHPDVVIGIDFPGFNLKMLSWAKRKGYPTVQYVLPQVWAWKESRIKTIKKSCDHILAILPFEENYCQKKGLPATFVGHPIAEYVKQFHQKNATAKSDPNKIVVFPGSRKSEVREFLPIILKASQHFPNEQFVVVQAPGISTNYYHRHLQHLKNVSLSDQNALHNLYQAKAAIVKSGTSTLETALMKVPEVAVYRFSIINGLFLIAFIRLITKFFSLPNIILGKEVIKELIQFKFTAKRVSQELHKLLYDENYIIRMKQDFDILEKKLLFEKAPSTVAAEKIIAIIASKNA